MDPSKISDFRSDALRVKNGTNDLTIFNEVSESLKMLNEQHRILHTTIKDMMSEYHTYHILSEKCEEVAVVSPYNYFENIYKLLHLITDLEFKD